MTELSLERLSVVNKEALAALAAVSDAAALEAWRIVYLGRKGIVPQLLRDVSQLAAAKRAAVGQAGNTLRQELEARYQETMQQLGSVAPAITTARSQSATSTSTTPVGSNDVIGHLHPLTHTVRAIEYCMTRMGFSLVEGPLLEDTEHDFDNLNIGPEHPARAESDTFYVAGATDRNNRRVLRTSTSAVQVRAVQELGLTPPFKVFSPGRVFRNEKVDVRHHHTFHQLEALSIGENVTVGDFKGVIEELFSQLFGAKTTVRLRPHYFPFTEPSFEPDVRCVFCTDGCRICKGTRWIEIGGAGMVHPNVLQRMNIDPDRYQGFAFGFGIERMATLHYHIDDVRLFLENDLRFLRQF